MDEQEKKNRRVGLWLSAGIHAVMALVLFFMVAWRAPDPPLPEYGIELNFGLDNQGTGDVQPDQPVGDQGESMATEKPEEAPAEQAEETPTVNDETSPEKVVEPVSKLESPVTVKEKETEKTPVKKPAKVESTSVTKEATDTPKKEATKESTSTEAPKKGDAASQGDDTNKTGDKGSEQGTLNKDALYGTPGGGGGGTGAGLVMTGWRWAKEIKKEDLDLPGNESGKVVFEIECDETGDIIGIRTVERTLSPLAEQKLKEIIQGNTLIREKAAGKANPTSKGYVTFVVTTK